jgi:hypothetical protein
VFSYPQPSFIISAFKLVGPCVVQADLRLTGPLDLQHNPRISLRPPATPSPPPNHRTHCYRLLLSHDPW